MPSLAAVFVVRLADLPAVTAAGSGGALDALQRIGHEIDDAYFWSGHNLLFLIQYLWRAKSISLFSVTHQNAETALSDDAGNTVIIIGPEHKPLVPRLDPATHDTGELTAGLVTWGVSPTEARLATVDALTLLHEQLTLLAEDRLLIIHVGER